MRPSQEIVEVTPPPAPAVEAVTTSSFIEQRIERLYGPGALAQVFYSKPLANRISRTPKPDSTQTKVLVDHTKSVPVMRLLRPEFRAQLTSASVPSDSSTTPKRPLKKTVGDTVDASNPSKRNLIGCPTSPTEDVKDGHYFLKKLDQEVKGLERVARDCEMELEGCDSESGCGVLRAVSGKARLLVAQKLNQFRGLCQKNINQSIKEDFPTTDEDLAGFWDMVMIQVSDVHKQFEKLDTLRKNDWKEEVAVDNKIKNNSKPNSNILKNKNGNVSSKAQSEASKARDAARRKMLQERRQAMKHQSTPSNQQQQPQQQPQPSSNLFIV